MAFYIQDGYSVVVCLERVFVCADVNGVEMHVLQIVEQRSENHVADFVLRWNFVDRKNPVFEVASHVDREVCG